MLTPLLFLSLSSILADYFDTASNRWESLLTAPWELSINASRARQSRLKSERMLVTLSIDSNPCHVSFSEKFFVSLGVAKHMWTVFSSSTAKAATLAADGDVKSSKRKSILAQAAARALITTLPYAIENHCGMLASFSLNNSTSRTAIPSLSTQFFQFELFAETGSGGMRRYGQDKRSKTLTLFIGDTEITVHDMDESANEPRSEHFIAEYRTRIFTKVIKHGKSTVRIPLVLLSHVCPLSN